MNLLVVFHLEMLSLFREVDCLCSTGFVSLLSYVPIFVGYARGFVSLMSYVPILVCRVRERFRVSCVICSDFSYPPVDCVFDFDFRGSRVFEVFSGLLVFS